MNSEKRNIIVGQSGGPTAAINSSLAGVYRSAKERGYKKVYGMVHGVQGLMKGHYIDLSEHIQSGLDEELLKRTPAAYLGSCRFQLPEIHEDREVFDKIFGILDELEIDCFIYIGGNDSMDTIKKLSDYGMLTGSKVRFVGCPKTIDNDLALTDHTPGYGSAAKYIGTSIKEIIRDGMSIMTAHGTVTVVEIMGRNAGWLTGAACLAEGEDCQGPDAIYLPEIAFDVDKFVAKCESLLKEKNSVVVCVSEGIKTADGKFVMELGEGIDYVDAFGHKQLSGTARVLANILSNRLSSSPHFREQLPTAHPVSTSSRLPKSAAQLLQQLTKAIQARWSYSYVHPMIRIRPTQRSRTFIRSLTRSALFRDHGSMRKAHM